MFVCDLGKSSFTKNVLALSSHLMVFLLKHTYKRTQIKLVANWNHHPALRTQPTGFDP